MPKRSDSSWTLGEGVMAKPFLEVGAQMKWSNPSEYDKSGGVAFIVGSSSTIVQETLPTD
jgi:hypothetical protein